MSHLPDPAKVRITWFEHVEPSGEDAMHLEISSAYTFVTAQSRGSSGLQNGKRLRCGYRCLACLSASDDLILLVPQRVQPGICAEKKLDRARAHVVAPCIKLGCALVCVAVHC